MRRPSLATSSLTRRRLLQIGGTFAVALCPQILWARQDGGFPVCLEVEPWYAGVLARQNLLRHPNPDALALTPTQALQRSIAHIPRPERRPGAPAAAAPRVMRGLAPERRSEAVRALETVAQAGPNDDVPLVQKALISRLKLWPARSTVSYAFVTADRPPLVRFIREALDEWARHTCLTFRDVTGGGAAADIRISFVPHAGHYSNVGTDSRQPSFSLNSSGRFESLNLDPSGLANPDYMRGTARHEVGHALGLNHEHQISDRGIVWNRAAVLAEFRASQGWSDEQIFQNIFQKLSDPAQFAFTPRDPDSVMHYWFKRSLILDDGGVRVPDRPNLNLSSTDKRFVAVQYDCEALPSGDGEDDLPPDDPPPEPTPPRIVSERRRLKAAEAKPLAPDTLVAGKFPSDPGLHLYRILLADSLGECVLETLDGARRGAATEGAMPVVIELFDQGEDFAAARALAISDFGAPPDGDEPGSLGIQDAWLSASLPAGKAYFVLVRPLERLAQGAPAETYRLLLRRRAGPRPKGSDNGSFRDLVRETELLQESIHTRPPSNP